MKKRFLTGIFILSLAFCLLASCDKTGGDEGTDDGDGDENENEWRTYTSNSGGNQPLPGSKYGYEMWTQGGNNNKLIWYGPNQRGGAAFRAEWNNPDDFLGRVGYYWGNGGKYTTYGNLYCDFTFTRSADKTAGNYSYIGIYGWSKDPLVEYYIVEDWFSNPYYGSWNPVGKDTIGVTNHGSYTQDGGTYYVYKKSRTGASIVGNNTTFTQYYSVRQSQRKSGTISITEHFKKWADLDMELGNMYECKFLVEAGGGIGWFEASRLKFR